MNEHMKVMLKSAAAWLLLLSHPRRGYGQEGNQFSEIDGQFSLWVRGVGGVSMVLLGHYIWKVF